MICTRAGLPAILLGICVTGAPVAAADLNLCWTGAGGYTMTGRMTVPDAAMRQSVVTQDDVTRFKIAGYLNGRLVGTWNLQDAGPDTTWFLRFDPSTFTFLTGGDFGSRDSQGWNADGAVRNCGNPGFGFNSGNYAQDVCVNGNYITESSIAPETPLMATTDPVTPDCRSVAPLSKSQNGPQSD
ncbi:hypothetical protein [Yoonia sp. 208BN28-4]|uniref:hypothetical protein n=1 Tax=Yoonia sp. 208BN28-4 TaxID=3126505 RepID=UPI0030B5A28D